MIEEKDKAPKGVQYTKKRQIFDGHPPVSQKLHISPKRLQAVATKFNLSQKQKAFVSAFLRHPERSLTAIAKEAGYTHSVARNATQNILCDSVKGAIEDYIKAGNYDAKIAKTYDKIFKLDENVPEDQRVAAHKLQLQAADQIHKIKGTYAPKRVEKRTLNLSGSFGLDANNVPEIIDADSEESSNE